MFLGTLDSGTTVQTFWKINSTSRRYYLSYQKKLPELKIGDCVLVWESG